MVQEADKGVSKIKPPPKSNLLEWIKAAQEKIESKGTIVSKSFLVAGITDTETEMVRSDEVYQEIRTIMEKVFGDTHVGYVDGEDPDDPFAECSEDESVSSEGTNSSDHNEDPCDNTIDEDSCEEDSLI